MRHRKSLAELGHLLLDLRQGGRVVLLHDGAVRKSATRTMSASFKPRVVRAGVPRRMPLVTMGGRVSLGTLFLLTMMPAASSAFSARRR